jgi:polysaccharide biosynthesis transport protein
MLKVQAERQQAQRQLDDEIRKLVINLRNEADVAERRERALAQSLSQLKEQEIITKDQSVDLIDMERELASSRAFLETLLSQHKQAAESKGFQLPDARIVELANEPLFPAAPKRKQLVLIATIAGLFGAIGLALMFEVMAGGMSRPEDVESALSLAHLNSIPSIDPGTDGRGASKAARLIVAEPHSRYAEAIRGTRRALDRRRTEPGPRIILVVSSVAGERAELVASNLAHHYAMSGQTPLLIDADMRLQNLTRQLAGQRQAGLLNQLADGAPFESAILRDGVTGLHFLPAAGPAPAQMSVSEAISSEHFAYCLDSLKRRFETIIIAAPPILPVIDARILADYADQIVFVVGWQRTPRQIAVRALRCLGYNTDKVAGVVLNDVAEDAIDGAGIMNNLFARASSRGGGEAYGERAA